MMASGHQLTHASETPNAQTCAKIDGMVRYTIHYSGRVQGVGFRYTCCACAENCMVAGYVMNLPDGRVKLVAEGEQEELKALVDCIAKRMNRSIHDQTVDISQANGEFGQPQNAGLRVRY